MSFHTWPWCQSCLQYDCAHFDPPPSLTSTSANYTFYGNAGGQPDEEEVCDYVPTAEDRGLAPCMRCGELAPDLDFSGCEHCRDAGGQLEEERECPPQV